MKSKLSILLLLCAATLGSAAAQTAAGEKSLYQRLGGYDAIAAVTDDIIQRFVADPQIKPLFVGLNDEHKKRVRQHLVDFLCQATGGPCAYTGRDMKTAHTGLHITEEQWQAAVKDITDTLNKFKVPEREKGEVLNAVGGLKGDIVGQ